MCLYSSQYSSWPPACRALMPFLQSQLPVAIIDAAAADETGVVTAWLATGGDMLAVDGDGQSLLHIAALAGSLSMLHTLIELGISPNVRDLHGHGLTPLHMACSNGQGAAALALLAAGANVDALTPGGFTPLIFAASSASPNLVHALIDAGANPTWSSFDHGTTPMRAALAFHRDDNVAVLLSAGAVLQ